MAQQRRLLGLGSGIGLVVANMVGAGVFISAGFMIQDMGPGTVLAAWVVGAVIAALTLLHAVGLRASKWTHNILVVVDALLLAGFVIVGLSLGNNTWPTWTPTNVSSGFPLQAFMQSLFFIAFAFSGWNAAVY